MTFHTMILGFATSQNWLALGINLILSTIIGGIVIVILLTILSKVWSDQVKVTNAFIMVLVINVINLVGVIGLLSPIVPMVGLILPLIIWIVLSKVFFSQMSWIHAFITGVVGFGLSIVLFPMLTGLVTGFIPL